jgi:RNA polymerase sigma-70 factor (ECF subfamily)
LTGTDSISAAGKELDETDLVRRVQCGENELFYKLVAPYQRKVFLTAYSILRDTADAEDVAQEAILKSFRHIKTYRGDASFATWLMRITINEAHMRYRRDRKKLFASLDANQEDQDDGGDYTPIHLADWRELPSEILERKEVREEIAKALAQLKPIYREVLVLRDVDQLNIAQTAEALGLSISAVKIRLFRARLLMRDILAPKLRKSSSR